MLQSSRSVNLRERNEATRWHFEGETSEETLRESFKHHRLESQRTAALQGPGVGGSMWTSNQVTEMVQLARHERNSMIGVGSREEGSTEYALW